ncbi:MAG: cupredoxin domain-containing protein [Roseiarcus sp.]|jgi:cupredoxin-like protein
MKWSNARLVVAVAISHLGLHPVFAEDLATYEVVLKNHAFAPAEIHVPTGKSFFVVVTNASEAADEFEMLIPAVEKGLQPGGQVRIRMRPLGIGRFPFFGESDPDNEKGAFVSE